MTLKTRKKKEKPPLKYNPGHRFFQNSLEYFSFFEPNKKKEEEKKLITDVNKSKES